jgi:poly(3-hydroxybutyrate) depolymerase
LHRARTQPCWHLTDAAWLAAAHNAFAAAAGMAVPVPLDVQGTAAGFVVLLPNAASDARGLPPHWRNDTARGEPLEWLHRSEGAALPDDVAFIWAAAACTRDVLRVPLSGRVHAAGWSQGAKMASGLAGALACAPHAGFSIVAVAVGAGVFDPAAAVASTSGFAPSCAAPTPLLLLQGGADFIVPFCGAGINYAAGARAIMRSINDGLN